MFSLYSNKLFDEFTDFIPFNQLYYVFSRYNLRKNNLRITKRIILLKKIKFLIRKKYYKKKIRFLIEKVDINNKFIHNLNSRITKKFDFNNIYNRLKDGLNERNASNIIYPTESFNKFKKYLFRILIITEIFIQNLSLIKKDLRDYQNFLSQTKDIEDVSQYQSLRNFKQFYYIQRQDLNKLIKFLKDKIRRYSLRLIQKYPKIFPSNDYKFEINWIMALYYGEQDRGKEIYSLKYEKYFDEIKDYSNYNYEINILDIMSEEENLEPHKRCNRCKKLKPTYEFNKTKGTKYTKRKLRYICRECESEFKSIKAFQKKKKVILNIFNNKFKGHCNECNIDLTFLPVLEFHHINPNIKGSSWSELKHKPPKEIIRILEKEKVILLCRNCHAMKQAKVYNKYKKMISRKDIFDYPGLVIDRMLFENVNKNSNEYNKKSKFLIFEWLKKRVIIEQLYDGKCINCQKINVINNLPSLEFHHPINNDLENKFRWKNLRNLDVIEIMEKLMRESCVCLCANCHKMVHSNNYKKIAKLLNDNSGTKLIQFYYQKISKNINNFKFKTTTLNNPLEKLYSYGEKWKIPLLHCYIISLRKRQNMINIDILERNIGNTRRNINKIIQKLKDKELLRILKIKDRRYVQLSEKGLYVIKCMLPQFIKYKNLKERIPNNENFKEVNALIELSELYDSLKHDDEIFY